MYYDGEIGPNGSTPTTWLARVRRVDGSYSEPSTLADRPGNPHVGVTATGAAYALWSDGLNPSVIRLAYRPANSVQFQTPEAVATTTVDFGRAALAVNGSGAVAVGWQARINGRLVYQVRVRPDGGSWSSIETLSDPIDSSGDTYAATLAIAPDGTVLVAYDSHIPTRVFAATRPPGGVFGTPQSLDSGWPAGAAFDPMGVAIVLTNPSALKAFYKPSGAGSFGAPQTISDSTSVVGNANTGDAPVQVRFDAAGNAVALWTRSSGGPFETRVEAARRPIGGSFGPAQPISALSGRDARFAELAVSPNGTALATWNDLPAFEGQYPDGQKFAVAFPGEGFGGIQTGWPDGCRPVLKAKIGFLPSNVAVGFSDIGSTYNQQPLVFLRSSTYTPDRSLAQRTCGSPAIEIGTNGSSGNGAGTSNGMPGGPQKPQRLTVSKFLVSPKKFRIPTGRKSGKPRRPPARFVFRLSGPGEVIISIMARVPGSRRGRGCVPPKTTAKGKRCTRIVKLGTVKTQGRPGSNKVAFDGRVGKRALEPGEYAVGIVAGRGSMKSIPRTTRFTVVQ